MAKKNPHECFRDCASAVKKANMEAYNHYVRTGKKEKYWSMVEDYNYSIVYRLIEEQIGTKNKKVCELGCGTAAHLKWYKRDCLQFVGLDISKGMLKVTMRELGDSETLNFVVGDALMLPFKNDVFDSVTIYQSAHHFPNIYECMAEMLRVAGSFAFFEPNKDSLPHKMLELQREKCMKDNRFNVHSYKEVEYNSRGFSAMEIKRYLAKNRAKSKVYYIFTLPMEISAKIMRRSKALFLVLSLFGYALTKIPIINSQFGNLLIIGTRQSENEALLS